MVAGTFVYLAILDARKSHHKIKQELLSIGFELCTSDDEKKKITNQLSIVNQRHKGNRLVMNLYFRKSADHPFRVFVCDYHFASAGGKTSGGAWRLFGVESDHLKLPSLSIEVFPEQINATMLRLMKGLVETPPTSQMTQIKMDQPKWVSRIYAYVDQQYSEYQVPEKALHALSLPIRGVNMYAGNHLLVISTGGSVPAFKQAENDMLQEYIQLVTSLATTFINR